LEYKADVNINNGRILETIISRGMAQYVNQSEDSKIDSVKHIEILIDYGVDFNIKNDQGENTLIKMCYDMQFNHISTKEALKILKIVAKNTSNINDVDNDGKSALDYLLANESTKELAEYLIGNGAKKS